MMEHPHTERFWLLLGVTLVGLLLSAPAQVCAQTSGGDEWGPLSGGYQLQVQFEAAADGVTAPTPPSLRLRLRKCTDNATVVYESYPEAEYAAKIWDENGEQVAVRPGAEDTLVFLNVPRHLVPGEEIVERFVLERKYAPLADGVYVLTATRYCFTPGTDCAQAIVSNPLFVVVHRGAYSVATSIPVGGTELVAARPALEKRGIRVSWDQARSRLVASSGRLRASFETGNDTMRLGHQDIRMSRPAQIIRGTFYVPAQAAIAAAALVTESASTPAVMPAG